MPGHGGSSADGVPHDIHAKRKREVDDGHDRLPQPPPPQSGTGNAPINYVSKANPNKLPLVQGDSEAFANILSLLADYEGVLSRQESLAANLGAKLTAPRLLRAMEGVFEGAISATPIASPDSQFQDSRSTAAWHSPSWLDIVNFAKAHPNEFTQITTPDGRRVCHFIMNNNLMEIIEEDWRLIMSGILDRCFLGPGNSLDEDEVVELATLDIMEKRLLSLIKQADDVAVKARQLNYHLSGRRKGINTRRAHANATNPGFQSINQPTAARAALTNSGYDLHADLLRQFLGTAYQQQQQSGTMAPSRPPSIPSSLPTPSEPPRVRAVPVISTSHPQSQNSSRPSPIQPSTGSPTLRDTLAISSSAPSEKEPIIPLIIARIEKLPKGSTINPPCDRCRRLNMACLKHLTACQGCTRKHAKCGWKDLRESEVAVIRGEPASAAPKGNRGSSAPTDDRTARHQQQAHASTDGPPSDISDAGRVMREISSRHRVGFTPTPSTPTEPRPGSRESYGGGNRDLARILLPEHVDAEYAPEKGKEVVNMLPTPTSSHRGGPGDYQHPQHALLSHMASAATLAVETKAASVTGSRGSSTGRE